MSRTPPSRTTERLLCKSTIEINGDDLEIGRALRAVRDRECVSRFLSQHPLPRHSLKLSLANALPLSSCFLNWLLKLK
jgi:hypothetical protein